MKIGCGEARADLLAAAILGDVYALAAFQKEGESPTALFTISFYLLFHFGRGRLLFGKQDISLFGNAEKFSFYSRIL